MRRLRRQWSAILPGILFTFSSLVPAASSAHRQPPQAAEAPRGLYRLMMVRAAPGKLIELIDLYKSRAQVSTAGDDEPPVILRHSQGDQWDLAFIYWVGSYTAYFSPERLENRRRAAELSKISSAEFRKRFETLSAWHEDEFVWGPPLSELKSAFAQSALFHAEMFVSLAGKQDELLAERKAENRYQRELSRPEGVIFTHDQGAAWDVITIAPYRSWKHFAERDDISQDRARVAANAAGFRSPDDIGPYLRTLIAAHHDTICTLVK